MNIKRIFGSILTVLGIISLIYAAVMFANSNNGTHDVKVVIVFCILGLIFFVSGISLVRTVRDD